MQMVRLAHWGDVALVAFVADDAPQIPIRAAFYFPPGELWDVDAIIKNWRVRMNARYRREHQAAQAPLAHTDKLIAWVAEARALAADVQLVYGDRLAAKLQRAASDVEETAAWVAQRIESPPRDPAALARLFVTIELWAFDQLRDLVTTRRELPGRDAGRTALLKPALDALAAVGLPLMGSDEGWKQRVRRLAVLPGQEANLIADVLAASRTGPFDEEGHEKAPS